MCTSSGLTCPHCCTLRDPCLATASQIKARFTSSTCTSSALLPHTPPNLPPNETLPPNKSTILTPPTQSTTQLLTTTANNLQPIPRNSELSLRTTNLIPNQKPSFSPHHHSLSLPHSPTPINQQPINSSPKKFLPPASDLRHRFKPYQLPKRETLMWWGKRKPPLKNSAPVAIRS